MISGQVTITTTATLIIGSDDLHRTIIIHVIGASGVVYLGGVNVTTSTGLYIDKAAGPVRIEIPPKRVLYGIVATGSETVSYLTPET